MVSGPELPIACTLTPGELVARGEMLGELARRALIGRARAAGAVKLRFRDEGTVQGDLERFIELESQCCAFLQFSLRQESGELLLAIEAPTAAEPVLSALYEALGEQAAHAGSGS